jgi:hypothetical protein
MILLSVVKYQSVLSFQDLCLKEEPELGDLDISEFGLEGPLQYDVSPLDVEEEAFADLSELTDAILHMRQENMGKLFQVHY